MTDTKDTNHKTKCITNYRVRELAVKLLVRGMNVGLSLRSFHNSAFAIRHLISIPSALATTASTAPFSTMASSEEETKPDIKANLQSILSKVKAAYESADPDRRAAKMPRLLAVSKTKPKDLVIEAYQEGHRDFGENYVQEFKEKSTDPEILEKCPDIRWHFIGKCQSNKIPLLAKGKNLRMVETVESQSWVDKLQNRCVFDDLSVGIMVQVNTSGEESKNGVEPKDVVALAEHVRDKCPNLKVLLLSF